MISIQPTDDKISAVMHTAMESNQGDFLKGFVEYTLRDGDGNVLEHGSSNQVIYLGRHRLMRVVCGDTGVSGTELTINRIKVAGGAVVEPQSHLSPTPPAITDTGLFETVPAKIKTFTLAVPTFNSVAANTVPYATFSVTLTAAATDLLVNEAVLCFGATGPAYAHYTFNTQDLRATTNNSLDITWKVYF